MNDMRFYFDEIRDYSDTMTGKCYPSVALGYDDLPIRPRRGAPRGGIMLTQFLKNIPLPAVS